MISALHLPKPVGPHPVGSADFVIEDGSRIDPFASGEIRRIPARVWYPAALSAGADRPYRTAFEAAALGPPLAEVLSVDRHMFDRLSEGSANSKIDAPAATLDAPAPVVIFSPGYYAWLDTNTALMEHLASEGVVAIAIAHPHEASATVYPDGKIVPLHPSARQRTPAEVREALAETYGATEWGKIAAKLKEVYARSWRLTESAPIWRDDMLSAAGAVRQGKLPACVPEVDILRLAFVGQSFGGPAAVAACERLTGCRASVNLDGRDYNLGMMDHAVGAPTLLLYQEPPADLGVRIMYNDLHYERWVDAGDGEVWRYIVSGAGHWDFTDYTLTEPGEAPDGVLGPASGKSMLCRVNALVSAFLSAHGVGAFKEAWSDAVANIGGVEARDLSSLRSWARQQ